MNDAIDISKVVLQTPRLILRFWREDDLLDFNEYASVDGVGEAAGWKHHESLKESEGILRTFINEKNIFAIEYSENKKVIGSLGLHDIKDVAELKSIDAREIGYVLSKDYWGKGLMNEAVTCVIEFCFDVLRLDALTVGHFLENVRSKRVIEKCGFEFMFYKEFFAPTLNKTFTEAYYVKHNTRMPLKN